MNTSVVHLILHPLYTAPTTLRQSPSLHPMNTLSTTVVRPRRVLCVIEKMLDPRGNRRYCYCSMCRGRYMFH